MTTFKIDPSRSTVRMKAESSVHPIEGEAEGVEGSIQVDVTDGALSGAPTTMVLELPVEALESGNPLYDREMRRRIDARKYSRITGTATSVEGQDGDYRVTGEVSFHGQTNSETNDVTMSLSGSELHVEGSHTFDIRDYGVTPPKILMLKVQPEVEVSINLYAQAQD
ncbi:MAG: YceI family protein [Euzebya sp.]